MTAALAAVQSLEADRSVVRIAPEAKDQLERETAYLRSVFGAHLTQRDLTTTALMNHLDELRDRYVGGPNWPDPAPALFDDPVEPTRFVTGRRDLARSPKVLQPREKTSVSGDLLDWVRAGVQHRREHGEPHLQLVEWMNSAVLTALQADLERFGGYPTLQQALDERYGSTVEGLRHGREDRL